MPTAETPAAGGEGLAGPAETADEGRALVGELERYCLDTRYSYEAVGIFVRRNIFGLSAALRGPAPGDGSGEAMREAAAGCAAAWRGPGVRALAASFGLGPESLAVATLTAAGIESAIRALPIPAGRGAGGERT